MKQFLITLALILAITNLSRSQTLEETLSNLSEDAGIAYVGPVISAFGSNMNSGWVNGVPSASILGLDIQIRIIAIGSFFNADEKTFLTHGEFNFTSEQADDILQASGIDPGTIPNYDAVKAEILSQVMILSHNEHNSFLLSIFSANPYFSRTSLKLLS